MKKLFLICMAFSFVLFSCEDKPMANNTENEISTTHSDREKELLEKEKALLERELALSKKENEQLKNAKSKTAKKSDNKKDQAPNNKVDVSDGVDYNIVHCSNKKFIVKVDKLEDGKIRYTSWNKPKTIKDYPDLFLFDPTIDNVEEVGEIYTFRNEGWTYIVEDTELAEYKDATSIKLRLINKGEEKYFSKMKNLRN